MPPHPPAGFLILADHVTIQGFRINFGGQADCTPAIAFIGSYNTFADNYLYEAMGCPGIAALINNDPDGGSDYNTIERNTIDGGDTGMVIQATAVDAINRGDVIRDNTIRGVGSFPLAIENAEGFLVSGNRILGSVLGSCIKVGAVENLIAQGHHTIINNATLDCGGNGIYLFANPGAVMTDNRIAGNTILRCAADCLVIEAHSGGTVTNNEVASNTVHLSNSAGILLAAKEGGDVNGNMILDNLVSGNLQSGISLTTGADKNRILNNEVRTNLQFGIAVAGDNNLIVGNLAKDNTPQDLADFGEGNSGHNNTYGTANW